MAIVVCNWKTYIPTADDASALVSALVVPSGLDVVVCPSSLHISAVSDALRARNCSLGAQDISVSGEKAQTGRLSGVQLLGVGVRYVLVGHAETRAVGVSDDLVSEKAVHALESGIVPIVCVSEQHSDGVSAAEVSGQLDSILSAIRRRQKERVRVIVAYEPTAHIGSDSALEPDAIQHVAKHLRRVLTGHALQHTPLLYGGAVDGSSVGAIVRCVDVDGLLIGRASLDADTINGIFSAI